MNILAHNLAEPAYDADVAQLEYKLVPGDHGLIIRLKGFNHKLPVSMWLDRSNASKFQVLIAFIGLINRFNPFWTLPLILVCVFRIIFIQFRVLSQCIQSFHYVISFSYFVSSQLLLNLIVDYLADFTSAADVFSMFAEQLKKTYFNILIKPERLGKSVYFTHWLDRWCWTVLLCRAEFSSDINVSPPDNHTNVKHVTFLRY